MSAFCLESCEGLPGEISRVREYISRELGSGTTEFLLADIPFEFQYLAEVAKLFGVSDDSVRDAAVLRMSPQFVRAVRSEVDLVRPQLELWLGDGSAWTDAKSAYDAMAEAFPEVFGVTLEISDDGENRMPSSVGATCAELRNPQRRR